MTSSITRSSRSSNRKTSVTTDNVITKAKTSSLKKNKKRIRKDVDLENQSQQQQQTHQPPQSQQEKNNEPSIDVSEHPEYVRLMSQLDRSKNERLQKVENWRNFERQSIHDWFLAQKKQAWDDFYFARKKARSDLVQEVQNKIIGLKQELAQLNKHAKVQHDLQQECDYEDWVPPERLHAIGSFVAGASNDEVDRDLTFARQPYNGSNTPNLIYSDYESRSTTDTAEEGEAASPSRTEISSSVSETYHNSSYHSPYYYQQQQQQQQHHQHYQQQQQQQQQQQSSYPQNQHSNHASNYNNSRTNNPIYPPFEFEEVSQDERRNWWPYRSTTAA